MGRGNYIWERMKEHTAQNPDSVPFQTIIEITGDRRVLIENHRGVVTYGREKILVKVKYGCVCISGSSLEMAQMTKEQLVVFGNIHCISLQRRDTV